MPYSIERVRKYPGMFLGGTDYRGLQIMARTAIDYAIDAYLARHGNTITVNLLPEDGVNVITNSFSLPLSPANDLEAELHKLFLQPPAINLKRHTEPYITPWFADLGEGYRVSGLSRNSCDVLNALSRAVTVEVSHEGRYLRQEFQNQQPVETVTSREETEESETSVTFYPDSAIFESTRIQDDLLYQYLRQSTYLVPGLAARLIDQRQSPPQVYEFPATNGVGQWILDLSIGQWPYTQSLVIMDEDDMVRVHIALQYTDGPGAVLSFANNYRTIHGGTHVAGFRAALEHAWTWLEQHSGESGSPILRPPDLTAHLTALISVWMPSPLYRRSTASELYNPEVKERVFAVVRKGLLAYFAENIKEMRWFATYGAK